MLIAHLDKTIECKFENILLVLTNKSLLFTNSSFLNVCYYK